MRLVSHEHIFIRVVGEERMYFNSVCLAVVIRVDSRIEHGRDTALSTTRASSTNQSVFKDNLRYAPTSPFDSRHNATARRVVKTTRMVLIVDNGRLEDDVCCANNKKYVLSWMFGVCLAFPLNSFLQITI